MIPTFVLLTAVGGGLRLALNVAVRRKLGLSLGLPLYSIFFVRVFLRFRRAPFFTKIFWWNNTTAKMLLDAAKEDESSGRTLVAFGRIYQAQLKYG